MPAVIQSAAAARFCRMASLHGIRTHNAIKALHLDDHFGSKAGGCKPGAKIEKLPSKFKAVQKWNANRKLGQATAFEAMDTAMKLADEYGIGFVSVEGWWPARDFRAGLDDRATLCRRSVLRQ